MKSIKFESIYPIFDINSLCEIGRGRVIIGLYFLNNKGDYPVYSSQTTNKGT